MPPMSFRRQCFAVCHRDMRLGRAALRAAH